MINQQVEDVFNEFWKDLVAPNGELDADKVKAELFDYHTALSEVSAVYCELTWGRFSKPNTAREHIIGAVREFQKADYEAIETERDEAMKKSVCQDSQIQLLREACQAALDFAHEAGEDMGANHWPDMREALELSEPTTNTVPSPTTPIPDAE